MNPAAPESTNEFYRDLPKIDLHRHLEGSLRIRTMMDVARTHGMNLQSTDFLRPLVQVREDEPLTFQNFLSKFTTLRQFYRSPEIISRITREAISDAAVDNVRYLELRFTPVALSRFGGFSLSEVIDWVTEESNQAAEEFGLQVRLIASVNRHESVDLATEVMRLAIDRQDQGLVGLDLAGNEAQFPASPFIGVFNEARQAGLHLTVHAGEWGSAGNVAAAIVQLNAERIGHGVRILEDPAVVAIARGRGIPFEVCITSNYQTGVVPALSAHPLAEMLKSGLNVTINTDDPSISQITLSDEYRRACQDLGLTLDDLRACVLSAAEAAFLPEGERQQLVSRMAAEFPG
jgi:adenosine deaminase